MSPLPSAPIVTWLLGVIQETEEPGLDLSDDEELAQAFDMHSLIVSSLHHEDEDRVETADDVIRQIENMMKVV